MFPLNKPRSGSWFFFHLKPAGTEPASIFSRYLFSIIKQSMLFTIVTEFYYSALLHSLI